MYRNNWHFYHFESIIFLWCLPFNLNKATYFVPFDVMNIMDFESDTLKRTHST